MQGLVNILLEANQANLYSVTHSKHPFNQSNQTYLYETSTHSWVSAYGPFFPAAAYSPSFDVPANISNNISWGIPSATHSCIVAMTLLCGGAVYYYLYLNPETSMATFDHLARQFSAEYHNVIPYPAHFDAESVGGVLADEGHGVYARLRLFTKAQFIYWGAYTLGLDPIPVGEFVQEHYAELENDYLIGGYADDHDEFMEMINDPQDDRDFYNPHVLLTYINNAGVLLVEQLNIVVGIGAAQANERLRFIQPRNIGR